MDNGQWILGQWTVHFESVACKLQTSICNFFHLAIVWRIMRMTQLRSLLALACCLLATSARADDWVTYPAKDGPGKGKHIVFLAGDEEYRSEEGLPMLAKILSQRHGFKCTVLFSLDKDGFIDPDKGGSLGASQHARFRRRHRHAAALPGLA